MDKNLKNQAKQDNGFHAGLKAIDSDLASNIPRVSGEFRISHESTIHQFHAPGKNNLSNMIMFQVTKILQNLGLTL